jgi:four helix bundle protein
VEQFPDRSLRTKPGSRSYKDLQVWQRAFTLVKSTYELTAGIPASETYGLTAQMRRAVVSIPSNIAEGQARRFVREFMQFLSHAEGSAAELETQLLLAIELRYCSVAAANPSLKAISEIQRMLASLQHKLVEKSNGKPSTEN